MTHQHQRAAVVTGGSRGIGRGIVELLAERGAAVGFAFQKNDAPARELEAGIRDRGGENTWAYRALLQSLNGHRTY